MKTREHPDRDPNIMKTREHPDQDQDFISQRKTTTKQKKMTGIYASKSNSNISSQQGTF